MPQDWRETGENGDVAQSRVDQFDSIVTVPSKLVRKPRGVTRIDDVVGCAREQQRRGFASLPNEMGWVTRRSARRKYPQVLNHEAAGNRKVPTLQSALRCRGWPRARCH